MSKSRTKQSIDQGLMTFFKARSIAIVGASNIKGKVGFDIVHNLSQFGYTGKIIPINIKENEIQGYKSYSSLSEYKGKIDLVFISIPAKFVCDIIDEMGSLGIKYVVIITAGFKEIGPEGAKLEELLHSKIIKYKIRAVGPNVVGLLDSHTPLNGSFASRMPLKGNLGFISQSGALITGILDWSLNEGLGFSKFISVGNKVDIDEVELIQVLNDDHETHAILAYLESINKGRKFIEICKKVSKSKPIIVLKSGSSKAGARAASSHTGSMSGSNTAYDAAFKKAGVIRASSVQELFDTATAFSTQPLPHGSNLCIITNAGGPGIIATDFAEFSGLTLAPLSSETMNTLRENLPPASSTHNPVDVLGTGTSKDYEISLRTVLSDGNVHMVLIIMTPQGMTEPVKTANQIINISKQFPSKPIAAAYMGGVDLAEGTKLLKENGIPCFSFPERGISSLAGLFKYSQIQQSMGHKSKNVIFHGNKEKVSEIFESVINKGRVTLLGSEAIEIVKNYGIDTPATKTCFSVNEAVRTANEIGYPVAMKITSPDIIHKTDIGGVKINVKSEDEVRLNFIEMMSEGRKFVPSSKVIGVDIQEMSASGRELIVGISADPQFGHLIMIGAGGIYANYQKDVSFGLAPLSEKEGREMLEMTKIYQIMQGVRGEKPDDINSTVDVLLKISSLINDFPEILELDINPLFVFKKGVCALDVKITISKEQLLRRFS